MSTITPITLNSDQNAPTIDSMMASFYGYFKLIVANTPELREEVYRIRYKVYCQELGYEREEDCKNGMEQDIYDQRSTHCLLMHTKSGLYAGCVRLVLPDQNQAEASLPFERVYGHTSQSNSPELKNLPRHSFGEVSRLAVTAEFRKRNGEWQTPHGISAEQSEALEDERRHFPLIALGLYLAATSVGIELGLDSALTLMEPRLARHLRRFGIKFCQIGELIEFRGQRGLFQITRSAAMNGMSANSCELFQMLRTEVKKSLPLSTPSQLHSTAA